MSLLDFFSGFFLMNAMPHFVLGVWEGRMLSLFGLSPWGNIAYGLLNFTAASALFIHGHGTEGIAEHGIFAGALTVLLLYFVTAKFFRELFRERESR